MFVPILSTLNIVIYIKKTHLLPRLNNIYYYDFLIQFQVCNPYKGKLMHDIDKNSANELYIAFYEILYIHRIFRLHLLDIYFLLKI